MRPPTLTYESAHAHFSYDKDTGVITWKVNSGRNKTKGKVAGGMHGPYMMISYKSRLHLSHRVAWLMHYGEWPKHEIDHINQIKTDNRINNLRDVPKSINMHNISSARVDSSTKTRGVFFNKRDKVWRSTLWVNGEVFNLGTFRDEGSAKEAYIAAKVARGLPLGATQ